ncbi:PIN-like domain-containing protein, partial [Peptoniphilus grossensis]
NEAYRGINDLICYSLKNKKNKTDFSTDEIIKVCEEGKIRFENLIPPGFSDKNKKEYNKYNDLLIWKEILNYTKENKSIENVIFLIEDMKDGNWWDKKASNNEKRKIHRFLLNEFNSTVSSNDVVGRKIEFMTITDFMGHYDKIGDVIKLIEFDSDKIADVVFYVYRRDLEAAMFNQINKINPIDIDEEFYRSDLPEFEAGDLRLLNNGIKVVDDTIRCRLSIGLNVDMNFEFTDKEGDKFELGEAEVFLSARAYIDLKYKTDCQKNRYEITYPDKIEETNFELKYVNMQVLNSKNLYDY